ncbi:hypothetical protein RRG08_016057 [Elysia crispata]|uniref:Uncharacterized protein n=1 Tax=Elysia crispata TaxID=231223 RepID=A0AAE0ZNE3_9GAST|nr:hypothetical protein RRG08_016057 [Elysia crispata]
MDLYGHRVQTQSPINVGRNGPLWTQSPDTEPNQCGAEVYSPRAAHNARQLQQKERVSIPVHTGYCLGRSESRSSLRPELNANTLLCLRLFGKFQAIHGFTYWDTVISLGYPWLHVLGLQWSVYAIHGSMYWDYCGQFMLPMAPRIEITVISLGYPWLNPSSRLGGELSPPGEGSEFGLSPVGVVGVE